MLPNKKLSLIRLSLLLLIMIIVNLSAVDNTTGFNSRSDTDQRRFFSSLRSDFFLLQGLPRIENNTVDVLKIPRGLSVYRTNAFYHEQFRQSLEKTTDYEDKTITLRSHFHPDIPLYYPVKLTFDRYLDNLFKSQFKQQIREQIQQEFVEDVRDAEPGLIPELVLDLPPLPGAVRKFIGDRPTRLSLTGSQRLTLSGSSTKRDDRRLMEGDRGTDLNLEMRQDLNLRLRGTIGDKISVNVRHSSQSDLAFMDPSTIEIEYEGDEDEIIQSIKAGNISLSLTGSEFIRYSASSTGLFGIRSDLKFGDLEITAIASKEEAEKLSRRFTGTDAADSLHFRSHNYATRTHYYVVVPSELYQLYGEGDDGLPGYIDNAIRTDPAGRWLLQPGADQLLPDPAEPFEVYLDTWVDDPSLDTVEGWELGDDPDDLMPYQFEILDINTDYFIDYDTGILTMNIPINRNYAIGVAYTQLDGQSVGGYINDKLFVKPIRRNNQNPDEDDDTWPLQARNIYNLNRRNIQNDGFRLNFFTFNPDGTINYFIDDDIIPGGIEFNDYLRLDTNGDGLINGYDETVNLSAGYVILPMIEPFKEFSDNIIYETERITGSNLEQITVNMSAVGKVGRDRIELGQMNILQGSVRVRVDGETLQEDTHYIVDYDFGHISFLTERGRSPDSNIEVDYEYRPLFATDSKTLMGLRADWHLSDLTRLGGTFIYHSETSGERRTSINNENRTLLMADIDGRLEFDPPLFTKLVDMIPLIRTDERSQFRLSGEIAMTMPRIYGHRDQPDRKEAYLDDMEGNVDTYPLGLSRLNWSPASKPHGTNLMRARPNWYNPDNIIAEDVFDPEFLTQRERTESVQIMTLRTIPPEISNPGVTNQYWGGIMRHLGNEINFSDKKYIELLVRADKYPFQDSEPLPTIHIDLGDISENFYVWNGGKGVLNTEDGANDGVRDGILEPREDVGLDGIPEGEPGDDPYDNFSNEKDEFGDYPWINGTSGNGILDTEDLNGNGVLDMLNRYFQYSVNLKSDHYESEYNGWRLYRIPMDDFIIKSDSPRNPNLNAINYARVWMETDELTRVQIARLNVVGNRWEERVIKDRNDEVVSSSYLANNNEFHSVSVVDNQNNRDHYVSPPNVEIEDDGIPLLDQALAVDYNNLRTGHSGMVTRRFREFQNITSYGKLRYWVYLERGRSFEQPTVKGDQEIIFRIGADSLNYYEIRYPAEAVSYHADGMMMSERYWQDIEIDFSTLTSLKQNVAGHDGIYEEEVQIQVSGESETATVKVRGDRVTLTNIRKMSIGVINNSEMTRNWTGRLYVNDIRVADPFEELGLAARTSLNTTFADFSTLNMSLVWRSQNFNTNVSRRTRPSYEETLSFDITNRYNLHKFFPTEWGLNIPLTLSRNQTTGTPRFKANSDILRADIQDDEERRREKRESLRKSADISLGQNITPRSKILQYTVANTTLRGNIRYNENLTSTSADTTLVYSATMNYNLNIPRELLGFNLSRNYRINFFPHSFNNTASFRSEEPNRWRWNTSNVPDTVSGIWTKDRYSRDRRELDLSTSINHNLTPTLTGSYTFSQKRDLKEEGEMFDTLPLGRETERDQNITYNYNPTLLPRLWTVTATTGVRYREVQKPFRESIDDEIDYWEFDGNVNRNARINVRLNNRDLLQSLLDMYGIRRAEIPETQDTTPADDFDEFDQRFDDFDDYDDEFGDGFGYNSYTNHNNSYAMADDYTPFNETMDDGQYDHDIPNNQNNSTSPYQEEMDRIREKEETERDERRTETATDQDDEDEQPAEPEDQMKLWARMITYLARFENFTINYDNTYGSRYSRYEERPGLLYQLGLPGQIEDERENLDMKENRDNFSVATGYPIMTNLSSTLNYSRTIDKRYSTASQKEVTTVFPNVRLSLTEFHKLIRAEKLMTSSRLSSSYTYTERVRGSIDWDDDEWEKPSARNKTHSFSPLISWQASWHHRITTNISYNHSQATSLTYRETYTAIRENTENSITTNFSWSFRSPQGLKLPFFSTRMPITNEMTTELGINWDRSKSINEGSQETIVERDTERYRINPRISYNFSRNIRGGMQTSYELNHDRRRDEKLRTISLSVWAEITF